jgi:nucleosome binding factor SPN SPT16 subunit
MEQEERRRRAILNKEFQAFAEKITESVSHMEHTIVLFFIQHLEHGCQA